MTKVLEHAAMAINSSADDSGQRQRIPTWLEAPASCAVKPPVETRDQELPFDQLAWEDFERLCLRLARSEGDVEYCRLYGVQGQSQGGIDLYARRAGRAKHTVYQCKRVEEFGPQDIIKAVDAFLAGEWAKSSDCLVLCVSASLMPTQRTDELEKQRAQLIALGIELIAWDFHQLSQKLKSNPQLVDDFFGREWVRCFNGEDQARALQERLDAGEIQRLRVELCSFYQRVFSLHDPGLRASDRLDDRGLSVEERFVLPDITELRTLADTFVMRINRQSVSSLSEDGSDPSEQTCRRTSADDSEVLVERDYGQRQNVDQWLAANERTFVIGGPGSGKSSLLRFLALDLLSDEPALPGVAGRWGLHIPVWVPFPHWTRLISQAATSSVSVEDVLYDWFNGWNALEFWPLTRKSLRDARLLLLVDGLDEWASEEAAGVALQRVQAFAISGRPVPTIITTRPHGFQRLSPSISGWAVGQLASFTSQQQRKLATKWFAHRAGASDDQATPEQIERRASHDANGLMNELRRSPDLHELATVPFLLTLLIYFRFTDARLPTSRFQAYRLMLDHLSDTHPQRRRRAASIPEARRELSMEDVRKALAHLAYMTHLRHSEGQVPVDQARAWLREFLADPEGEFAFDVPKARGLATELVEQACDSIGLLVRQSPDSVGFLHRAFQECLSAECLASLPWIEQLARVESLCMDPTWREVILALLHMTRIPDNVDALIARIEACSTGPTGRAAVDLILAEAAFGDCGCRAPVARRLAETALAKIEEPGWIPLRNRLLDRAMSGLQSSRVSSLVRDRLRRWYPCRDKWRERTYQAMSLWPCSPELLCCLFAALSDEEGYNRRGAAAALAAHAKQDSELIARLVSHVKGTTSIEAQAAAFFVLLEACPKHPEMSSLANGFRHSADPDLRLLALLAVVRLGCATTAERDTLLERDDQERFSSTWSGCRLTALLEGWPRSPEVKIAGLRALARRWGPGLDAGTAWMLLLKGYPNDDDVARRCAEELENEQHPFIPAEGVGEAWSLLRENFRDHPLLVAAVDEWLAREQHDPIAIHHACLIGRTSTAKRKLLEQTVHSWPWWAVGALVEGWPEDPEVQAALGAVALGPARQASEIAESIPGILPDPANAGDRLVELLGHPDCSRPDFVMRGLNQLPMSHRPAHVVDIIVSRLPEWRRREGVLSGLFMAYAHDTRVRAMAIEELEGCGPNVRAIALGFKDDPEIRQRVIDRSSPLPKSLRYRLVMRLGQLSHASDDARELLQRFDDESDQEVKAQACIEHCRLLRDGQEGIDAQLATLREMALSRGIDHTERRLAAFCGFATLGRLDALAQLRESTGDKLPRHPVVVRGLEKNQPFLHCLLEAWDETKSALGANFPAVAFGTFGPGLYGWDSICQVAHAYPAGTRDAIEFLESVDLRIEQLENLHEATFWFLSRVRPKSELLRRYCSAALKLVPGSYGGWATGTLAADLLAEHFWGDPNMPNILLEGRSGTYVSVGLMLALAEGWPDSEFFKINSANWIRELYPAPAFRLACRIECATDFVERFASIVNDQRNWNPYLVRGLVRPLIRRVQRDDEFCDRVVARLGGDVSSTEMVSIVRVLSAAGCITDAVRSRCDGIIAAQQSSRAVTESAFDLLVGQVRPVTDCLLEALDPLT